MPQEPTGHPSDPKPGQSITEGRARLISGALWLGIVLAILVVLIYGKAFIVPLVLAVFAMYLIHTLEVAWSKVRIGGRRPPAWLATTLSVAVIVLLALGIVAVVAENATQVAGKAPVYQKRVGELTSQTVDWVERVQDRIENTFAPSQPADGEPPDQQNLPGAPDPAQPEAGRAEDQAPEASAGEQQTEPPELGATPPPDGDPSPESQRFDLALAIDSIGRNINIGRLLSWTATSMAAFLGNAGLVFAYLFFLLLERPFLKAKIERMLPDPEHRTRVMDVIAEIDHDIRIYMGVKTLASTITAVLSWAIMTFVGLDFAEFWALLIFLFNFIPNIGSLIATALPTLLALAQFDTLRPFAIVGIGVTAVQLLVANLIEPNLTGKSLNMSPLVVMLALVLWGMLWGAVGMLLCVPITAVIMIVLSHFPSTRWLPILLSKDGDVRDSKVFGAEPHAPRKT